MTLTGDKRQTANVILSAGSDQQEIPANKSPAVPPADLPNAPSATATAPSCRISASPLNRPRQRAETGDAQQANPHAQNSSNARLNLGDSVGRRRDYRAQAKAKGKNGQTITEPTAANLDFHIALGGLTTGLYGQPHTTPYSPRRFPGSNLKEPYASTGIWSGSWSGDHPDADLRHHGLQAGKRRRKGHGIAA